jgi:hypothetical protein
MKRALGFLIRALAFLQSSAALADSAPLQCHFSSTGSGSKGAPPSDLSFTVERGQVGGTINGEPLSLVQSNGENYLKDRDGNLYHFIAVGPTATDLMAFMPALLLGVRYRCSGGLL